MAEDKEKKTVIRLSDRVGVKVTEKNPAVKRGRLKAGQIREVHPSQVAYLKSKGFITVIEEK
jgi:hypothetical protein